MPHVFSECQQSGQAEGEAEDQDGEIGAEAPDQWLSLILVMMYEFLHQSTSFWRDYLQVLPDSFETPMFWSLEELSHLQASSLIEKIGKEQAEDIFRSRLLPVIRKYAEVFYPNGTASLSDQNLLSLAHRMGSAIMAYAFDLENDEDDTTSNANSDQNNDGWIEDNDGQAMLGMVPMADMLNADAEFNAHVNHGENSLTVTSLRPIKAGEEILNYYGPHPNSDLLRRYGYVTPKHSRYDVVELRWETILSIAKQLLNISEVTWGKALSMMDPEELEDTFVLERDSRGPDSDGLLKALPTQPRIPSDMEEQINLFLKSINKIDSSTSLDRPKRKAAIHAIASKVFEAKLAQYQTTVEEDAQLLLSNPSMPLRKRMAIAVRMGEKKLLQEALQAMESEVVDHTGAVDSNQPPRKKVRAY